MVDTVGAGIPPIQGVGSAGGTVGATEPGTDFASFVRDASSGAVDTMYQGEAMSKAGITGAADLNDVVAAVNDAELTLQTITTLRDRLVQAYQEIIRMPI